MGFDDLFEHQSNQRKYGHHDEHSHDRRYMNENHHYQHSDDKSYYLKYIINKVKNNRKLKILFGLLGIVILAIIIVLAIILIPLIVKLVNFISEHGVQGVVDNISGFLNKIWKGAGK